MRISCEWRWVYIHDSAVDVAKLLEPEQPRAVCAIVEDIAL